MKIYRIISDLPDGRFLCYVGSTGKGLKERLQLHERDFRRYLNGKKKTMVTSFKLLKRPWYEIALCEDLGDCSKSYMLDKEAYYINYYKGLSDEYEVVNKCNPNGLDLNKVKQCQKQYHKSDKHKQYQKSDKVKQYRKQYQKSDKFKLYKKQYYLNKKKARGESCIN